MLTTYFVDKSDNIFSLKKSINLLGVLVLRMQKYLFIYKNAGNAVSHKEPCVRSHNLQIFSPDKLLLLQQFIYILTERPASPFLPPIP